MYASKELKKNPKKIQDPIKSILLLKETINQ